MKKKYNIDTTISFLTGSNLVNILSKNDDKIIISVRSFISKNLNGFYGGILKFLIKKIYNKANKVIAVSKVLKNDLIENYNIDRNRINVIYNPYDIEKIIKMSKKPLKKEYRNIFSNTTIVNMGRLTKAKGQWHLLRVFKKVKEKIPDLQLVILGKGELEEYLINLTNKLNLSASVHFLGFQNNPFNFIAKSDLYVFPSLFEGFPNALVEAMTCGVPVISADCKSGPREILAPNSNIKQEINGIDYVDYGVLVGVCDDKFYDYNIDLTNPEIKLYEAIITLLNNNNLRKKYSELAINRIEDFNIESIIKEWENEI